MLKCIMWCVALYLVQPVSAAGQKLGLITRSKFIVSPNCLLQINGSKSAHLLACWPAWPIDLIDRASHACMALRRLPLQRPASPWSVGPHVFMHGSGQGGGQQGRALGGYGRDARSACSVRRFTASRAHVGRQRPRACMHGQQGRRARTEIGEVMRGRLTTAPHSARL